MNEFEKSLIEKFEKLIDQQAQLTEKLIEHQTKLTEKISGLQDSIEALTKEKAAIKENIGSLRSMVAAIGRGSVIH